MATNRGEGKCPSEGPHTECTEARDFTTFDLRSFNRSDPFEEGEGPIDDIEGCMGCYMPGATVHQVAPQEAHLLL